jgi:hypothetical protein
VQHGHERHEYGSEPVSGTEGNGSSAQTDDTKFITTTDDNAGDGRGRLR